MTSIRNNIVIIGLLGLLIYGAYLMKCRLGIDVDEYRDAGDYISAIAHPQRFADARAPSSLREKENLKVQDAQPVPATITVDVAQTNGRVKNRIFGNNLIAYDPATYEQTNPYYGYSDFGAGIWDSKWNKPVKEVLDLGKEAGITVLRFPGGCGVHHYNWKGAIGKNRRHFLYGIDEFLKTCKEMGAEAIITVSYFTGDEGDAADLVEYLNAVDDGSHKWATERVKNGNNQPFGVKYFEIGNEDWHGDHRNIREVLPEEYADRYLKYYAAMKGVDPSIQIGAILSGSGWNKRLMKIVKDKIDFGIIHTYPSPEVENETLERMDPKDIFSISLAKPAISDEYNLREAVKVLKEKAGKDVPLAITEYNGGFVQEKPVPYRHCLGTALVNAELLRVFMKPENNILMANYWNFNNSYTGMIYSKEDYMKYNYATPMTYYKRPNYYVYELYHKVFEGILLETKVNSKWYDIKKYSTFLERMLLVVKGDMEKGNLLESRQWTIQPMKGVETRENKGILSIKFIDPILGNYFHVSKNVSIDPETLYEFSGYIKTENLNDEEGVCLEVQDARGWQTTHFAVQTIRINGTTEWFYVSTRFKALPDAKGIKIIARRNSNALPLKGTAYFKDVQLHKFNPKTSVSYLSVNASTNDKKDKVSFMVINKNMVESMIVTIYLQNFIPAQEGNAWTLNGPSIDATNENKPDNVKIVHKKFKVEGDPFEFIFEPHSLTAIEIEKFKK